MKEYTVKGSWKGSPVNAKVDSLEKAKKVALDIYGAIYLGKDQIMTYSQVKKNKYNVVLDEYGTDWDNDLYGILDYLSERTNCGSMTPVEDMKKILTQVGFDFDDDLLFKLYRKLENKLNTV